MSVWRANCHRTCHPERNEVESKAALTRAAGGG